MDNKPLDGVGVSTISRVRLTNFTAFGHFDHRFASGITIITGANGTGKTHLLKLIYASCAITVGDGRQLSFAQKIANVFRPYEFRIGRLIKRQSGSSSCAIVIDSSDGLSISYKFSNHTKEATGARSPSQTVWKNREIISAFIPVKEMLAHAPGFIATNAKRELAFEDIYSDILKIAYLPKLKGPTGRDRTALLDKLQEAISGKVITKGEVFFLKSAQGDLEFSLLAEGMRKLALVWLLIQNGTLLKGSVLLWDEPEANLNPALMEQLVDVILQLQRNGVQIILTTHNSVLLRLFELKKRKGDSVEFVNLKRDNDGNLTSESANSVASLQKVAIQEVQERLYDTEIRAALNLGL